MKFFKCVLGLIVAAALTAGAADLQIERGRTGKGSPSEGRP